MLSSSSFAMVVVLHRSVIFARDVVKMNNPDNQGIVAVKLAPPINPLPQVSAEIAALRRVEESSEQENLKRLNDVAASSFESAKASIDTTMSSVEEQFSITPKPSSFLQIRGAADQIVRVRVAPAAGIEAKAQTALDRLEGNRQDAENEMFDQAAAETQELGKIAAQIFDQEVRLQMDPVPRFLQTKTTMGLVPFVNVRIATGSNAFPSVGDLVLNAEAKRDSSESAIRFQILALQGKLLNDVNAYIKKELLRIPAFASTV